MLAAVDHVAGVGRALLAMAAGILPRRHWPRFDSLPVARLAVLSGLLTLVAGLAIGARGLLAYSRQAADAAVTGSLELAARQARHQATALEFTTLDLQTLSVFSVPAFLLFTPLGLLSLYLAVSGLARTVSAAVDQPLGDPLLTTVDGLACRGARGFRRRRAEASRHRAEGPEVPDRLYTGDWAGLPDADFVVVASRRKAEWTAGTFVITSDKWYTLGEPFDVRLPYGLRTIYPLKVQTVPEVLRRGIAYELPPLSRGPRNLTSCASRPAR